MSSSSLVRPSCTSSLRLASAPASSQVHVAQRPNARRSIGDRTAAAIGDRSTARASGAQRRRGRTQLSSSFTRGRESVATLQHMGRSWARHAAHSSSTVEVVPPSSGTHEDGILESPAGIKPTVEMSAAEEWTVFPNGSAAAAADNSPEGSIFAAPSSSASSSSSSSSNAAASSLLLSNGDNDDKEQEPTVGKGQNSFLAALGVQLPDIPDRYLTVGKASLAFVLANMDKVNLSVAIIPMSHQYHWSASTAGLVQSSFFWGYALSLIPSGWLAQKFTGQRVLKGGVVMWSLATAAVPLCHDSLPLLLLLRGLVGFGEGVAPPAATDLVARTMPPSERTRAVAAVFNGFNVGSILGLLASPILIERFGWQSVFYVFGAAGVLWCLWFNPKEEVPVEETVETVEASTGGPLRTSKSEADDLSVVGFSNSDSQLSQNKNLLASKSDFEDRVLNGSSKSESDLEDRVPWRAILQRPAVWALVYIHFCNNWGHFCILAWLPTFYNDGLHLNLGQSALISMVPPVLSLAISAVVAPLADKMVQRGTDVTAVRKLAQGAAFLVPSFFIGLVAYGPELGLPQWAMIALLSLGVAFSACSYAGLYCAHQDMSRKYASILLGLSTTVGAIPGIVGVPLTGVLYDATHSWMVSLFLPSIFFYLSGTVVWSAFGDCRPQHFEDELKLQS